MVDIENQDFPVKLTLKYNNIRNVNMYNIVIFISLYFFQQMYQYIRETKTIKTLSIKL